MRGGRMNLRYLAVAGVCFRNPGNAHLEKVAGRRGVMCWPVQAPQNIVRSWPSDRGWSEQGWWCWKGPAMENAHYVCWCAFQPATSVSLGQRMADWECQLSVPLEVLMATIASQRGQRRATRLLDRRPPSWKHFTDLGFVLCSCPTVVFFLRRHSRLIPALIRRCVGLQEAQKRPVSPQLHSSVRRQFAEHPGRGSRSFV